MLCTRPNENIGIAKETLVYLVNHWITISIRPFISRVDPKDQLGINPVRKVKAIVNRRRGLKTIFVTMYSNLLLIANPILSRHRQWLENFKEKMREKRDIKEAKDEHDKEKFKRVSYFLAKSHFLPLTIDQRKCCFKQSQNSRICWRSSWRFWIQ